MNRYHFGNIRTFETRNFRVSVDAYEDEDTDLSFDETGRVCEQLKRGELIAFSVDVTVTHKPTGIELGTDSLGGCIYKSIEEFQDHRKCGVQRRRIRRNGRFQIYRKARKHECVLSRADKLRKRGFATRERAEQWAQVNAREPWEVFEIGRCGSYFADMVHSAIAEARKRVGAVGGIRLRAGR